MPTRWTAATFRTRHISSTSHESRMPTRIEPDEGIVTIGKGATLQAFIDAAKRGRIWGREPKLRGHA